MTRRTLLAFAVGFALLVALGLLAESAGVGSWGMTAIGAAVMLVMSLIDREWFYGVEPRSRR